MAFADIEVDTFIGNHTIIDPDIFRLWVGGYSIQETTSILQSRGILNAVQGATVDLLVADVLDNYRTYTTLEKLLHTPSKLSEQWTYQLHPDFQQLVLAIYYDFDDVVMREILGKKFSARQRKELDEVSEKTGINLKSCRRQFDNMKRIFKAIEEHSSTTVSAFDYVKDQFCFDDELARKYCAVIFIAGNRLETSKRKLQYLTFTDFYNCANSMMVYWSCSLLEAEVTADMEREFLMDLRDLRILLEKEKEHKMLVLKGIKGKVSDRIFAELETNFKAYSRTLINIAYGLNHSKEFKDLFVDLVEKFIEPCKHLHWPLADLKYFLQVYTEVALQLDILKTPASLKSVFKRYMDGISGCLTAMYHP